MLPLLGDDFELGFDKAITIIVGENGTGKSTLLEGIAVWPAGDDAGGGAQGLARSTTAARWRNGRLAGVGAARELAAQDYQRLVLPRRELLLGRTLSGRGEQRWSARGTPPDFLSHSHGEGFLRFFEERCQRQGIFIFDERDPRCRPRARSNSSSCCTG